MPAIHITVDLEDRLKAEIRDMESLPLYGAVNDAHYQWPCGRLKALQWVLQLAHVELDECCIWTVKRLTLVGER